MAAIRYDWHCGDLRKPWCGTLSFMEGVQDVSADADKGGINKAGDGREAIPLGRDKLSYREKQLIALS